MTKLEEATLLMESVNQCVASGIVKALFQINSPMNVTCNMRVGAVYKNKAVMGEEKILLLGAYLGKRGDLILRFAPTNGAMPDVRYIEFSLGDASRKLDGFRSFWGAEIMPIYEEQYRAASNKLTIIKSKEFENDPRYGSW